MFRNSKFVNIEFDPPLGGGAPFDMVLDKYMKLKYLNLWQHWLLSISNVEFVSVSHNPTCKYVTILCWRCDDRNVHSHSHHFLSYKSHVTTTIMIIVHCQLNKEQNYRKLTLYCMHLFSSWSTISWFAPLIYDVFPPPTSFPL